MYVCIYVYRERERDAAPRGTHRQRWLGTGIYKAGSRGAGWASTTSQVLLGLRLYIYVCVCVCREREINTCVCVNIHIYIYIM